MGDATGVLNCEQLVWSSLQIQLIQIPLLLGSPLPEAGGFRLGFCSAGFQNPRSPLFVLDWSLVISDDCESCCAHGHTQPTSAVAPGLMWPSQAGSVPGSCHV
jgi:hypothetical protein